MELEDCLTQCETMIRKGSSTFHKAFSYLPSPKKEAVYVIYAFCRMIDDSVDEPKRSPYTIDELEASLTRLEDAEGHFIWPALRWLFQHFPVQKTPFIRQMEGQRRDLLLTQYVTMEQLEEYCYLVAGTVGEMLLPVLHEHPVEHVVESGIYLGKAMQVVNIVRDIGEDLSRGRRYLPLELLRRHGYSEQSLLDGRVDESFRRLVGELDALARKWLLRGLHGLETYPPASGFSIELAARFYEAILDEVKLNDYQVFHKRAVVGNIAKLKIYTAIKKKYASLEQADESRTVSL